LDDEITLRALLCLEGVVRAAEDRPAVLLVSGAWWDLLEVSLSLYNRYYN
jgi:hypothetical protein